VGWGGEQRRQGEFHLRYRNSQSLSDRWQGDINLTFDVDGRRLREERKGGKEEPRDGERYDKGQ
jgi:hypothetical protein